MTEYDYTYRICLFARENVGIKTLVGKEMQPAFLNDTSLTISMTLYDKIINSKVGKIKVQFFNLSNKEQFKFLWHQFSKDSDGIMVMYDIKNVKSLKIISEICEPIKKSLDRNIPLFLAGNKLDLETNREVTKEEVEILKKKYNISSSMEISAKTGENSDEMFLKLTDMMYKRYH